MVAPFPTPRVVAIENRAFGLPSTKVDYIYVKVDKSEILKKSWKNKIIHNLIYYESQRWTFWL